LLCGAKLFRIVRGVLKSPCLKTVQRGSIGGTIRRWMGVLGVLIRAKAMGETASVQAEIAALRNRAGFFIASSLEAEVLRSVGE